MQAAGETEVAVTPPASSSIRVPFVEALVRREGNAIRCLACTRRCLLHDGSTGYCTAVANLHGVVQSLAYGVVAEASVTPIESKPVYHYLPGSRVLSLGGLGCNLRCRFCQNWELAFRDARSIGGMSAPNLSPARVIELAIHQGCHAIAWSHNEPSISPMFTLACAQLARQAGLFTVYVTNGLLTHEALDLLGPWLNVYRVDVKSVESAFYQRIGGTAEIGDLLPIACRAQQEYGIHVEAVTNLMPGLNDSDEHLKRLAERLVSNLGPATPHHLTTYIPYALMRHIPATPLATLLRAREIEREAGLAFVYVDHPAAHGGKDTVCPICGAIAIKRWHGRTVLSGVGPEGTCAECGAGLHLVVPPHPLPARNDVVTPACIE